MTGATLYVTQQKVQSAYLKLFQEQFEAEVNYFTVQQESRLSATKNTCHELAKLPALRAALLIGDPANIYDVATNFLGQQTLQNTRGARRRAMRNNGILSPAAQAMLRNREAFFYVLDTKGTILRSPETRNAPLKQASRKRLETQFVAVFNEIDRLGEQTIGYLAPERTNGAIELLEVIVTKVTDTDTDNSKTIAALVVGVPFLETSEKAMSDFSQGGIESGIWLDDKLHSKTIPAALRDDFSQIILNKMKTPGQPQDALNIMLGGIPRQVFFKLLNPNSPFPPAYQVSLYSMAGAMKTERELRWQILAFSSAALAAALVAEPAHRARPFHSLARVGEGNRGDPRRRFYRESTRAQP